MIKTDVNRSIARNAAGIIVALEDALPPPSDPAAPPLMSELSEFSYDIMGRLTAATHPERFATALPLETYSYSDDGLGRRTGAATGRIIDPDTRAPADDTLVYDPDTDQLLEDGLYTYAYDDNGNRVGKTRKSDGVTTTYKYDAFDRLIYAGIDSDDPYPPTSALDSRVYYAYDWAGRLARRISGCKADLDSLGGMYQAAEDCVVTRYAYDGLNLAAEYAEDGSPLVIYNHAPGSIDRPVSMQIEGAVFYFHYDERGSVTHITNGFGHIVQRYVYDSFGRIVLQQGALPNAFTYTGRHWDPVARLYHYRARAYDPDTGSFLQHDPIPAANPYAYTDNDPVNFTDPLGLKPEWRVIWGQAETGC
ncbi:MAG TPA: RHS repeat-associated core domain-containing protein [bacterium]|nr:RHS repeat-associated core domain-containing protein [bacterium]